MCEQTKKKKKKKGRVTKVGTEELSDQGRERNAGGHLLVPCAKVIRNKYDKSLSTRQLTIKAISILDGPLPQVHLLSVFTLT